MRAPTNLPLPFLRQCFRYDAETGALYWRERPREHFSRARDWQKFNTQRAGCRADHGPDDGRRMVRVTFEGRAVSTGAHRVAFALHHDVAAPAEVDHQDLNEGNNRPSNLRAADRSGQCSNRRAFAKTGLPKGVTEVSGRFRAQITFARTTRHLGTFDTAEQAHAAYCAMADFIFGEFARH